MRTEEKVARNGGNERDNSSVIRDIVMTISGWLHGVLVLNCVGVLIWVFTYLNY